VKQPRPFSYTQSGELLKSPAHLKAYLDGEKSPPSDEQIFGKLVHTLLLEPEAQETRIDRRPRYFVLGESVKDFRSNANQAQRDSARDEYGYAFVVKHDTFVKAEKVRDAVLKNPEAKELLDAEGETELGIEWTDARTGIACRGFVDKYLNGTTLDIKTAANAAGQSFRWAVKRWGYHRQGAMYLSGLEATGRAVDWRDYRCLAIETSAPFLSAVHRISTAFLEIGRREVDELLDRYKLCLALDDFPGYPGEVIEPPPGYTPIYDITEEEEEDGILV